MIILIRKIRKARKERAAASTPAAGQLAPAPGSGQSPKPKSALASPGQARQEGDYPRDEVQGHELRDVGDPQGEEGPNHCAHGHTSGVDQKGKCVACKAEKHSARVYRWKLILGLLLPFAAQSLDATIIASALPWIAADFREISQLNWIITAFNLTSAAFIPFWGQMADIFGRHYSLQVCLLSMMVGSALSTGAPTDAFAVLLLGRALQGLGCAGIGIIIRIVLADKVSLEDNAKNWTVFSVTAGMSYGIGPTIGDECSRHDLRYLTNANWRWCFAINLPICLAAIIIVFVLLRKELLGPQPMPLTDSAAETSSRRARFSRRLVTIDAGGQLLFLFGFGLLILALTWGGATYSWGSAPVLVPLCIGVVLVAGFGWYEKLMAPEGLLSRRWPNRRAMVPWKLVSNRNVGLMFYITFCTGASMYSVLYFVSLYFTIVKQYTAGHSGVQLLYYVPGLGVGAYSAMFMCNVYPKKTFYPILFGSITEAVGVGVLAWALYAGHLPTIFGMMALTGAGTGMRFMPTSLHVIGFFPGHIATVVSLMGVALPFGGTLALTIMATVFNNTSGIGPNSPLRYSNSLAGVPEPARSQILNNAKMGVVWAFVAITPFMILCVSAALVLGNVNVTKERNAERDVVDGVYLLHCLRSRSERPRVHAEQVTESAGKEGDAA